VDVRANPDAEQVTGQVPALRVEHLTKFYGSVRACNDVSLELGSGEILGLLGENGAGKSTLAKALVGLVRMDSGKVYLAGKSVRVRDPVQAAELGIAMVQQHLSLIESLRVWENVALSLTGRPSRGPVCKQVAAIAAQYGLDVDPTARVDRLTLGQRQRVELVRALAREPAVLIMDEPTSVLSAEESVELFRILRGVVATHGRSVMLISHHLKEVLYATDRVMVMRDGSVVASGDTADFDEHMLARAMVGRDVVLQSERAAIGLLRSDEFAGPGQVPAPHAVRAVDMASDGPAALRIDDLHASSTRDASALRGLTLDVAAGEIVGVAGVEGNGQTVLAEVLAGLTRPVSGSIQVGDKTFRPSDCKPGAMLRAGVGVIPEDRHHSGCVLDMSIAENLMMAELKSVRRVRFLVNRTAMQARASELARAYGVSTPSVTNRMRSLSGGNQQRVVLAREVSRSPKVLVAAQPTRGLDVAAVEYMAEQFQDASARGIAILFISSDLEEIIAMSHRIVVIHSGTIVGEMAPADFDADRLGLLMGGHVA
jgi:general nucleoside transport system ATP-binding protein